jgi:hypothetical protein
MHFDVAWELAFNGALFRPDPAGTLMPIDACTSSKPPGPGESFASLSGPIQFRATNGHLAPITVNLSWLTPVPGPIIFCPSGPPTTLTITIAAPGWVEICWPDPRSEWVLQQTPRLTDAWSDVGVEPPPVNGRRCAVLPSPARMMFYRLRIR